MCAFHSTWLDFTLSKWIIAYPSEGLFPLALLVISSEFLAQAVEHVIESFSSLCNTIVATDTLYATMGQTENDGNQIFCLP